MAREVCNGMRGFPPSRRSDRAAKEVTESETFYSLSRPRRWSVVGIKLRILRAKITDFHFFEFNCVLFRRAPLSISPPSSRSRAGALFAKRKRRGGRFRFGRTANRSRMAERGAMIYSDDRPTRRLTHFRPIWNFGPPNRRTVPPSHLSRFHLESILLPHYLERSSRKI